MLQGQWKSDEGTCLFVPLPVLAGAFLWDGVIMGFATEPVWSKASGFPLGYGQTGVSFYNNNESVSEVVQSCLTLCNPMDCSQEATGLSVHGIFQAKILEWVAISFSRSSWPRDRTWVSHIVDRRFTVRATREVTHNNNENENQCNSGHPLEDQAAEGECMKRLRRELPPITYLPCATKWAVLVSVKP